MNEISGLKGYGAAGKQVLKMMGGKTHEDEGETPVQNELQLKIDSMINTKKSGPGK